MLRYCLRLKLLDYFDCAFARIIRSVERQMPRHSQPQLSLWTPGGTLRGNKNGRQLLAGRSLKTKSLTR
jgi:hypothetical protein